MLSNQVSEQVKSDADIENFWNTFKCGIHKSVENMYHQKCAKINTICLAFTRNWNGALRLKPDFTDKLKSVANETDIEVFNASVKTI